MTGDAELDAMAAVKDALADLDPEAQERVVAWAIKRFDIPIKGSGGGSKGAKGSNGDEDNDDDEGDGKDQQFEHFAELYDAAGPSTKPRKVLVAAYWHQKVLGTPSFQAFALNKDLKDLGHGVDHISEALDACIAEKPALVLQLKKSGKTPQARKTYKLTAEGIKIVESMIAASA
jgi:hypothetical protein